MPRQGKFISTLNALEELMRLEYRMLERLRDTAGHRDGENTMVLYVREFSSRKIYPNESTVLYTKIMYNNFHKYINMVDPSFFRRHASLKRGIDSLMEKNRELEEAFL
jgi:hypothetical protein